VLLPSPDSWVELFVVSVREVHAVSLERPGDACLASWSHCHLGMIVRTFALALGPLRRLAVVMIRRAEAGASRATKLRFTVSLGPSAAYCRTSTSHCFSAARSWSAPLAASDEGKRLS